MAPRQTRVQKGTAIAGKETSVNSIMVQDGTPANNPSISKTAKLYEQLDVIMANAPSTADPKTATATANPSPSIPEFVTMPRPPFDFSREHDEEEREEMEEERPEEWKKLEDEFAEQAEKYFKKSLADFPGWTWVISKKAYSMYTKWDMECQKRDQDRFGMHIYNDFSGYGVQEVFENIVCSTFLTRALVLTLLCSFSHSRPSIKIQTHPHMTFGPMSRPSPG
jgi:hypothetical protein